MALFTTFITTPIVMAIYKPARRAAPSKSRTVERADPQSELRVLTCFHSIRNIPTMINLIESSRGTRRRRVTVYAMHLMELSERSSAISMVHKARRNGLPFWNKLDRGAGGNGDHVVVAFEAYQRLSNVAIRPMTAISDLHTIHEDIVASALQKRVALITLPFHKMQRLDGSLESLGAAYQHVNQRVLRNAPCSVAILVDRGLGGQVQVLASDVSYTIAVLFFGGPDDREALAYAARMAEHPGISLTVVRFLLPPPSGGLNADERAADNEAVSVMVSKAEEESSSVKYEEQAVAERAEVVGSIKALGRCNLFLVGRSPQPGVAPLVEGTDCPELGPVGCYLACSEFSTSASALVIQRYVPRTDSSEQVDEAAEIHDLTDTPPSMVTPDSSIHQE